MYVTVSIRNSFIPRFVLGASYRYIFYYALMPENHRPPRQTTLEIPQKYNAQLNIIKHPESVGGLTGYCANGRSLAPEVINTFGLCLDMAV